MAGSSKDSSSKRAPSAELGDEDFDITYNARTGRPVRRTAGRRSTGAGFIDTTQAVSDAEDTNSEEEEKYVRPRKKRRRSPSPPMPASDEDDTDSRAQSSTPSSFGLQTPTSGIPPINLTFNVPPGHQGPIQVTLDIASLLGGAVQLGSLNRMGSKRTRNARLSPESEFTTSVSITSDKRQNTQGQVQERAGFLSLPPELRNDVYRMLFVLPSNERFNIGRPSNFCRSAAFLRTCRQVHEEARPFLYSMNKFLFQRNTSPRIARWTSVLQEVGFKDLRFFLKSIGPANLSLIRRVNFLFEDAVPSLNPDLTSAEERRFVYDNHLMAGLNLLADYAQLQHVDIAFYGRKQLCKTDVRFIEHMKDVKADIVHFTHHPIWGSSPHPRIDHGLKTILHKSMTRAVPLHGLDQFKKKKGVCRDTEDEDW